MGRMSEELDPFQEEPLDEEEKEALKQDLVDVQNLKSLLSPRGIKGTVFFCPDCNEDHYLAWDLLSGNLQELLQAGESPIHEPAYDPDPDEYVGWDYARGFLDGYESYEQEELGEIAIKLRNELDGRGFNQAAIKGLLGRVGLDLPPPGKDPEAG